MKKQPTIKNLLNKDQKRSKKKKIIFSTLLVFMLLPIVLTSFAAAGFAIWANGVSLDKSLLPTASAKPVFYDINGEKIEYLTDDYVLPEQIPDDLKNAFIALEDKRFYSHKGYDPIRIGGAIICNIKSRSVKEGASTITQQLVKNTHLSNERTINRKLKEIAIARKLEKEYSKDEILAMYLSVIYFGNGAYGVKQASRLYFDKEISDLSLQECATLAGIVKNPRKYSPFAKEEDCVARRNLVLSVMQKEGYISQESKEIASNSPLDKSTEGKTNKSQKKYCDYYIKKATDEVCNMLGITKYQLNNSGYEIYTNLDVNLQKSLYENANNSQFFESDDVQSVQIVVDNVQNAVVACYSSLGYDIKRQVGSVMKPIAVYAPAIDMNLVSLATPVVDEKIDFGGYRPSNFNDKYYGETTIRDAIKKSMNSIAVKTLSYVGLPQSAQYISNFGVNLEYFDQNYALALGATANGVSPTEICSAYTTLANNGIYKENSFVKYVAIDGNKIYISSQTPSRSVVKSSTASIITSALSDTVKDGTARTLCALPFDVAAKTGTVERADGKNSDAWCVGYNDNYTVCVWHGSDNGMSERGGGYPAMNNKKIWQSINDYQSQPKSLTYCNEVEWKDIDTYATKKYKQVMLSSQNTPIEYRKTEIFPIGVNIETSRCFDEVEDFDFTLCANANRVQITFDTQDIYTYNIYREDCYGKNLVCIVQGNGEQKIIYDNPLAFFDVVKYTIECESSFNSDIKKSSTKMVYVDDLFDSDFDNIDNNDNLDNHDENQREEDFDDFDDKQNEEFDNPDDQS